MCSLFGRLLLCLLLRSHETAPHAPTQVLGRGLAQLPRDQIVVATKVGRYGANTFDFRWAHVVNWEPPALLALPGLLGWCMTV